MPIEIRAADNADVEAVVGVIKPVYDEYSFTWEPEGYHADLYDIETHYDGENGSLYLATYNGLPVGTIGLNLFETIPGVVGELSEIDDLLRVQGVDCSLERLYVLPEARRLGVGTALFEFVISQAKRRSRKAMEIWSDKRFADAHRMYGRFGGEVVGDRICYDPDHSPEWGLIIRLNAPVIPAA